MKETTTKCPDAKRRLACLVIRRLILPMLDSSILWAWGWKRAKVKEGLTHYIDPNTGDYWLKDKAINICAARIRRAL